MSRLKEKYNSKEKSEKVLIVVFLVLLLVVLILSIVTLTIKFKNKGKQATLNYVIPLSKKDTTFDFNVVIEKDSKSTSGEYYFKVTNHRAGNIIKEDMDYQISFLKNPNIKIELYKNDKKIKQIKDNDTITSSFNANKEQTDKYKMKIKIIDTKKESNNTIKIRINS